MKCISISDKHELYSDDRVQNGPALAGGVGGSGGVQREPRSGNVGRQEEEPQMQITEREVAEAISELKTNRAAGPDGINNETLKVLKDAIVSPLTAIFNCILSSGHPPEDWHLSEIVLLHKKGDRTEMNNYRPISLTSNVSKVFMKILKNKIYNILETQQPYEQASFRRGFST